MDWLSLPAATFWSTPRKPDRSSLVGTDAFAGALTRGSFKTIPATEETQIRSDEEDSWLGDLDSNQE
jgi:hypothetical protein